ncbi:MAG: PEP-CTERM sorting domain-containing protein [Syntrophaceae bacterium]|nr:PEP-CTERM sorting domain-containing protein [Syntrophaceae bacterium]
MNRKSILMFFIVAALFATFTQSALAYTVTTTGNGGDAGNGYGPYQAKLGGEFTLLTGDGLGFVLKYYSNLTKNISTAGTFQSFCLEKEEYINPNTKYNAVLNDGAISGGGGVITNGEDLISIGTAWLYSQFTAGTLAGYEYSATGRKTSAAALQNAIWWLEGEVATNPNNTFSDAVINMFGSADTAKANSNGAYGVEVLNLTLNGVQKQDQLVVTSVPLPSVVWLFGTGLIGLVGVRRRSTT